MLKFKLGCYRCLPRVVCAVEYPGDLIAPLPPAQGGPDAWISEIRDYLKDNILQDDDVSAATWLVIFLRYLS